MILTPTLVSTQRLGWDRPSRTFTAEISDFGRDFRFGRVFDDACDIGLTLVNERTGGQAVCSVVEEKYDGEGELIAWILTPVNERLNFRVIVYND